MTKPEGRYQKNQVWDLWCHLILSQPKNSYNFKSPEIRFLWDSTRKNFLKATWVTLYYSLKSSCQEFSAVWTLLSLTLHGSLDTIIKSTKRYWCETFLLFFSGFWFYIDFCKLETCITYLLGVDVLTWLPSLCPIKRSARQIIYPV